MNPNVPVVLLAFLLFLTPGLLPAQDRPLPQNMIGLAADSVTGGPPSVMIRRVEEVEHKSKKRNIIAIDPFKLTLYYNVSYYHSLSYAFVVGGGVQFASHLSGDSDDANGGGLQIGAKYFWSANGPTGFHLDPTLNIYSVTHEGKKQTPLSFVADIGYKLDQSAFFLDFKLGGEYFLSPMKDGNGDATANDGMVMVAYEKTDILPHFAVQCGFTW